MNALYLPPVDVNPCGLPSIQSYPETHEELFNALVNEGSSHTDGKARQSELAVVDKNLSSMAI